MLRLASSRFLLSPYATSSAVFSALSLPSATRRVFVLCVSSDQVSIMVSFSSASFAESAERSAPSSIFFGSAYSYERGRGPCTVPPWRQRGERIEPTRARPVPFCRQSLRPAPLTSLLSLVLCVPARKPRRYHREASCSKCGFTLAPNTASASSTCPTFSPSRLTTSTTGIVLIPFSLTVLGVLRATNENICAAGTRHGTANQQQVFVVIHFHDFQVLGRQVGVAHVTRKVLVLPHARRKRTAANAARRAMEHRAVCRSEEHTS